VAFSRQRELHSPNSSRPRSPKLKGALQPNMRGSGQNHPQTPLRKFLNPQTSQRLAPQAPAKNEGTEQRRHKALFHSRFLLCGLPYMWAHVRPTSANQLPSAVCHRRWSECPSESGQQLSSAMECCPERGTPHDPAQSSDRPTVHGSASPGSDSILVRGRKRREESN
jgi:hypothetical protein